VICRGICSVMFNAPDQNGAWTQLLRRVALAHHDPELLAEVVDTYKLRDGSKALLTAILRDVQADVMLSTAVREIRRRRAGADVTLQDGRVLEARAVVVTAPIHALSRIGFVPALNDAKRSLMAAGQTTQGAMLWLRVAGVDERVLAIAAGDQPISYARWDGELADAALFNAFVPRASALDLGSRVELESALRRLLPAASVLDWRVHDWTADPAAGQTWAMLRPGQLSRLFAGLQEREGTVFFAGADYASGWYGFIDGAIESGLTAARHARLALDG
jgi:monoamine oxidase